MKNAGGEGKFRRSQGVDVMQTTFAQLCGTLRDSKDKEDDVRLAAAVELEK